MLGYTRSVGGRRRAQGWIRPGLYAVLCATASAARLPRGREIRLTQRENENEGRDVSTIDHRGSECNANHAPSPVPIHPSLTIPPPPAPAPNFSRARSFSSLFLFYSLPSCLPPPCPLPQSFSLSVSPSHSLRLRFSTAVSLSFGYHPYPASSSSRHFFSSLTTSHSFRLSRCTSMPYPASHTDVQPTVTRARQDIDCDNSQKPPIVRTPTCFVPDPTSLRVSLVHHGQRMLPNIFLN